MPNSSEANDTLPANGTGPPSARWEFPELAAVVILASVGALALGGLATGIAESLQGPSGAPSGFDRQVVGYSITFGTLWASFVLAAILLGLMGVCWWHLGEWEQESEVDQTPQERAEALGHASRTLNIVIWVQAALVLVAAGAISGLVGAILSTIGSGGTPAWAPDLNVEANTLAVLAMAATGVLFGRRLTSRPAFDLAADDSA